MNEIMNTNTIFESIRHIDEDGKEYWLARELQVALKYKEWRYFESVIEKAILSCKKSNRDYKDHFGADTKMVGIGSKTRRKVEDYKLSRYACYLIAQNGKFE